MSARPDRRGRSARAAVRTGARRLALALALLGFPRAAVAQQGSLQGIVTSSSTGAPLEEVTVVLERAGTPAYGTRTDRNGYYQVGGIAPGTYTLRARGLGQREHARTLTFGRGEHRTLNLRLEPEVVSVEGVVVSPAEGSVTRALGRQRITPAELRLVPVPAGTGDLAGYLQTLPGVVTTGDRGGQLFVRGGTPAENLVLVDGVPIFQPFHILGFFSAFPEELVSSVDFYAGGFGARYSGRTSSVLDVQLRDGDPTRVRVEGSASPFLAEALAEGPAGPGLTWIASARRSLVEETSGTLLGARQPLTFDSQLLKLTLSDGPELRCSALALRTSDRGRLDAEATDSYVAWDNLVLGGHCIAQYNRLLRLVEVNFSHSSVDDEAVSRGSSGFHSSVARLQHDAHVTSLLGPVPVYFGYAAYFEGTDYDLRELFGVQEGHGGVYSMGAYLEPALRLGNRLEVRPGVAVSASPRPGVEPRLRASWRPRGRRDEELHGAVGLYRQHLTGTSDLRDVGSVFTAWTRTPEDAPLESVHGLLGWQQSIGGVRWSAEAYYKRMRDLPVPRWSGVARFSTRLGRADGESYGADARVEYSGPRFYGFAGYGYGWTRYEATQPEFEAWFGEPVQRYHPPFDRRHQVNALASFEVAGVRGTARWQFGTGLPYTRPLGFDEALDYTRDLHDVTHVVGTTRLVVDRPFTGRLPAMHRLDVSLQRDFALPGGRLTAQAGAINAYDRRNMFYYDLFTGRRVDQLPFAPYASVTFRSR